MAAQLLRKFQGDFKQKVMNGCAVVRGVKCAL